jgi:hypothetical protein
MVDLPPDDFQQIHQPPLHGYEVSGKLGEGLRPTA